MIAADRPEVHWRAAGLARAGLVAQLTVPRLATRAALGIETPLAHAVVDRLLGFDRPFAESRLQITPVEWGVWTFLILRALGTSDSETRASHADIAENDPASSGPGDLSLDRVGPDPFDPAGLGTIVTVRWPLRIGAAAGAVRLWVPESVVALWPADSRPHWGRARFAGLQSKRDAAVAALRGRSAGWLSSLWRAEAGHLTIAQGLTRLRKGGVLPLAKSELAGTPESPSGRVDLTLDLPGADARLRIAAFPVDNSGGRLLQVEAGPRRESWPRGHWSNIRSENHFMNQPSASSGPISPGQGAPPPDAPVTLTVELGRVNFTLAQLADLKPGDVVELNRHSREPVELTASGKLVARGELILIDTELGVRVTNVFL
jgi:flagellar motor switch protein FliN